jgi:hypothetical protein
VTLVVTTNAGTAGHLAFAVIGTITVLAVHDNPAEEAEDLRPAGARHRP